MKTTNPKRASSPAMVKASDIKIFLEKLLRVMKEAISFSEIFRNGDIPDHLAVYKDDCAEHWKGMENVPSETRNEAEKEACSVCDDLARVEGAIINILTRLGSLIDISKSQRGSENER